MAAAPPLAKRVIGLAVGVAIAAAFWAAWESYPQFANVARWSGDRSFGWLRAWLLEFRTPLLCCAGFLLLSVFSWLAQKTGLGH